MEYECRPTYEQLSLDRIIDEANRNINAIKALENLITERLTGFGAFAANITRYRGFSECFENNEGSLRVSIDSFCLFIDQVRLFLPITIRIDAEFALFPRIFLTVDFFYCRKYNNQNNKSF